MTLAVVRNAPTGLPWLRATSPGRHSMNSVAVDSVGDLSALFPSFPPQSLSSQQRSQDHRHVRGEPANRLQAFLSNSRIPTTYPGAADSTSKHSSSGSCSRVPTAATTTRGLSGLGLKPHLIDALKLRRSRCSSTLATCYARIFESGHYCRPITKGSATARLRARWRRSSYFSRWPPGRRRPTSLPTV